jgi:hypothetical protein
MELPTRERREDVPSSPHNESIFTSFNGKFPKFGKKMAYAMNPGIPKEQV